MKVVVLGAQAGESFGRDIVSGLRAYGAHAELLGIPGSPTGGAADRTSAGRLRRRLVGTLRRSSPALDRHLVRGLRRSLDGRDPDVVITTHGYFSPEAVTDLRSVTPGATWVLWYPDAVVNIGNQRMFTAGFDLLCFKDPWIVDRLTASTDLPAIYLPQAAATHRFSPPEAEQERFDLLCYGNYYPFRVLQLQALPATVDARLYGNAPGAVDLRRATDNGMPRSWWQHRYLRGAEKGRAIGEARISLNTMHYGEIQGVNLRLFELAAAGGVILTEWRDRVSEYFDVGTEVLTYRNAGELREQVTRLLQDEDLRRSLRDAARSAAVERHTYQQRVAQLLERL